jgi:hypothetical protein
VGLKYPSIILNNVLVTTAAANKLTATPKANVNENPFTKVAPKELPNQNNIAQVINVAILESLIEGQARCQAISIA